MKKNWRITYMWLLGILIIGWAFSSFFYEATVAQSKNRVDEILSWVMPNNEAKNDIVKKFCDTMTWSVDEDSELALKQSLFVASLCSNWKKSKSEFFENADKFIKDEFSFKTIWFKSNCGNLYKENCDVAELADNLFTLILSELFTIREATVFGIKWNVKDFSNGETLKKWKNKFIEDYLRIEETEEYCGNGYHNQTCNMIEKQMKQFKKSLKNLKYINVDAIFTDDNKELVCSGDVAQENLVYCWVAWEIQWWLGMFVNVVYNEMEWYSIFSSYYWQILSQRDELPNDLQSEVIQSLSWPDKYLSLIEESITELLNISITYPLHVVMVAYEEDLLRMRDKYLVKIVTPIYCLYHKLRNVQYDK